MASSALTIKINAENKVAKKKLEEVKAGVRSLGAEQKRAISEGIYLSKVREKVDKANNSVTRQSIQVQREALGWFEKMRERIVAVGIFLEALNDSFKFFNETLYKHIKNVVLFSRTIGVAIKILARLYNLPFEKYLVGFADGWIKSTSVLDAFATLLHKRDMIGLLEALRSLLIGAGLGSNVLVDGVIKLAKIFSDLTGYLDKVKERAVNIGLAFTGFSIVFGDLIARNLKFAVSGTAVQTLLKGLAVVVQSNLTAFSALLNVIGAVFSLDVARFNKAILTLGKAVIDLGRGLVYLNVIKPFFSTARSLVAVLAGLGDVLSRTTAIISLLLPKAGKLGIGFRALDKVSLLLAKSAGFLRLEYGLLEASSLKLDFYTKNLTRDSEKLTKIFQKSTRVLNLFKRIININIRTFIAYSNIGRKLGSVFNFLTKESSHFNTILRSQEGFIRLGATNMGVFNQAVRNFGSAINSSFKAVGQFAKQGLQSLAKAISVSTATASQSVSTFANVSSAFIYTSEKSNVLTKSSGLLSQGFSALKDVSKEVVKNWRGIALTGATAISVLKSFSAPLTLFSGKLQESDNALVRFSGHVLEFSVLAAVKMHNAINLVLQKVGGFIAGIGRDAVDATKRFFNAFAEAESYQKSFERIFIAVNREVSGALGTMESWNQVIEDTAKSTGFLNKDLQASATEIILVGQKMGLTREKMLQLFTVAQDYAAQFHTNVLDTTIDMVSALGGATQGVIKYGIKLNDTTLKHQLLEKGIRKTVGSLSDEEKKSLRLNAILKEHGIIAGSAVASLNTLAGAERQLSAAQKNLSLEVGRGSQFVHDFSITTRAVTAVLNSVPEPLAFFVGLLTSLGGVILQVLGNFIAMGTTAFFVYEAIVALNAFLKTQFFQTLIQKKIALFGLNKSFLDLVGKIGLTQANFTSLKAVLLSPLTLLKVMAIQIKTKLIPAMLAMAKTIATKVLVSLIALATNPVVLFLTAVTGAIALVVKAFKELSQRVPEVNQAFSFALSIFEPLREIASSTGSIFSELAEILKNALGIALGIVAQAILSLAQAFVKFQQINPFGIFKTVPEDLDEISKKLQETQDRLGNLGNNIFKLEPEEEDDGERKVASTEPEEEREKKIKKLLDDRSQHLQQVYDGDIERLKTYLAQDLELRQANGDAEREVIVNQRIKTLQALSQVELEALLQEEEAKQNLKTQLREAEAEALRQEREQEYLERLENDELTAEEESEKKSELAKAEQDRKDKIRLEDLKNRNADTKEYLKIRRKHGKEVADLDKFFKGAEIKRTQEVLGKVQQFAQSSAIKNKTLAKASGVSGAIINTAQAVTKVFAQQGFPAGIPAAAKVGAIGVGEIATILSAQQGGLVEKFGNLGTFGDAIPASLQVGEAVVPKKNFDQLIEGEFLRRNLTTGLPSEGFAEDEEEKSTMVDINLTDDASEVLDAQTRQNENLQIGTL